MHVIINGLSKFTKNKLFFRFAYWAQNLRNMKNLLLKFDNNFPIIYNEIYQVNELFVFPIFDTILYCITSY